jgi:hypothetical protein
MISDRSYSAQQLLSKQVVQLDVSVWGGELEMPQVKDERMILTELDKSMFRGCDDTPKVSGFCKLCGDQR